VSAARRRFAVLALVLLLLGIGYAVRAQVARGLTFAGSDSYAYVGAAEELIEHGHYRFRVPLWYPDRAVEPPPGYGRLPGYPLLLAALLMDRGHTPLREYKGIFERAKLAQRALDVLTCALVFLAAWRVSGWLAGLAALLFCALSPPLILYAGSILTETLATCLSAVTVVLSLLAVIEERSAGRARGLLCGAGVALACATLVRIDGVLLGAGILSLLLFRSLRGPLLSRRDVAAALLLAALCYAPWPVRNLLVFGDPHPVGRICDARGREMPRTALFGWFATWVVRESQTPETLYCFFRAECVSRLSAYPAEAFDSPQERERLGQLLALRQREGISERVDQGFRDLARERLLRHPLRTLLWLPAQRAFHLWVSANDMPLRATGNKPGPATHGALVGLSVFLVVLAAAGALSLVRSGAGAARRAAVMLGLVLMARTGFLALIGFVDERYIIEVLPAAMILAGAGVSALRPKTPAQGDPHAKAPAAALGLPPALLLLSQGGAQGGGRG
jgi:4-amino-4-deoxy-L-arabinose transferase-like glycosyltransferase